MKKIFILLSLFMAVSLPVCAFSTAAMLQYNQGIDYYKTGQYDKAVESFRGAIKTDPTYIDAYYNLGAVLEYLGQYDAALAVFKQVIVRQPSDYDSVYKAAWLSHKLGQDDKARTYLSIIPKNCNRSQDAAALLPQLKIEAPAAAQMAAKTAPQAPKIEQNDGLYEKIASPTGITSDSEGNLYVAEFVNNSIIKITPDGKRIVYAKDPKISGPIGLACDNSGNLYIANYNKDSVLKVSANGEISVLISNVKKPYCLYCRDGLLFIACQGSNSVLKYKLK